MAMFKINTGAAVILLFLSLFFSNVSGTFPIGNIAGLPPTVFNVLQFGAIPNGIKDSTQVNFLQQKFQKKKKNVFEKFFE